MHIEYIKIIMNLLGVFFTALTGFLVAKYTYHRNRPLDKLEIAYDKIYYPIHQMLKENNALSDLQVIAQSDHLLKKYKKFADPTTIVCFNNYKEYFNIGYSTRKVNYAKKRFKKNISDYNIFLKYHLGYLVPSYYKIYEALSFKDKMIVNLGFGYSTFFLISGLLMIFVNFVMIQKILLVILVLILIISLLSATLLVLFELWQFILWILNFIGKRFAWIEYQLKNEAEE